MTHENRRPAAVVHGSDIEGALIDETVAGRASRWLRTAADRTVVLRALAYAVVVGAILVAINHGEAILSGQVDASRWLQIGLTVLVPYCVSTASSVGAMLERR